MVHVAPQPVTDELDDYTPNSDCLHNPVTIAAYPLELPLQEHVMSCVTRRTLGGLLLGCAVASTARAAGPLSTPVSKPILTISGRITRTNVGETASFDRAMLEGLEQEGFQTTTPWYTGLVRFDGVRMTRLLAAVGATGSSVRAVALNDYTTEIPISDFEKYGVILALKRDGAYMPIRDKGPLFIVYPFDSLAELKSQQFYSRSAWQVAKLVVS